MAYGKEITQLTINKKANGLQASIVDKVNERIEKKPTLDGVKALAELVEAGSAALLVPAEAGNQAAAV